eukprot:scaffold139314_cov172-Phaeocystis_antarctica.AAC.4
MIAFGQYFTRTNKRGHVHAGHTRAFKKNRVRGLSPQFGAVAHSSTGKGLLLCIGTLKGLTLEMTATSMLSARPYATS